MNAPSPGSDATRPDVTRPDATRPDPTQPDAPQPNGERQHAAAPGHDANDGAGPGSRQAVDSDAAAPSTPDAPVNPRADAMAAARRRTRTVTIVVPAKNEAAAIGHTLRSLPVQALQAQGLRTEVVVLDGNSRDGTAEIARRHGAIVLQDPGSGKGRALREARRYIKGDFVVMLDADGSYAPDAIPRVLDLLLRNEADIVMGDRQPRPGAMSGLHKVGNVFLSLQASVIYGRPCRDVCTGLWGFRVEALRMLPLRAHGFELEAELFALASRMRMRIAHVNVDYLPRTGEAKLSAGRDGLRIGWCLIESRFRRLSPPTPETRRTLP